MTRSSLGCKRAALQLSLAPLRGTTARRRTGQKFR